MPASEDNSKTNVNFKLIYKYTQPHNRKVSEKKAESNKAECEYEVRDIIFISVFDAGDRFCGFCSQ